MAVDPMLADVAEVAERPAPAMPTEEQYEAAATRIFGFDRNPLLDLHVKVGETIVDLLYAGSVEAFLRHHESHGALKHLSRRLAAHDLHWDPSQLFWAVQLFHQSRHFGGHGQWPHLTMGHMRCVFGMSWELQEQWLDAAEENHWTVEDLEHEMHVARGDQATVVDPKDWVRSMKTLEQMHHALDVADLVRWLPAAGVPQEACIMFEAAVDEAWVHVEHIMNLLNAHRPAEEAMPAAEIDVDEMVDEEMNDDEIGKHMADEIDAEMEHEDAEMPVAKPAKPKKPAMKAAKPAKAMKAAKAKTPAKAAGKRAAKPALKGKKGKSAKASKRA